MRLNLPWRRRASDGDRALSDEPSDEPSDGPAERVEPNYAYESIRWKQDLNLHDFVRLAYGLALCRQPSQEEVDFHADRLRSGNLATHSIFESIVESEEFRKSLAPLHHARLELIKKLPTAEVVVDLGGSTPHSEDGALYLMGYQPRAKRLVIVDLLPDRRFGEWKKDRDADSLVLERDWGRVEYWYQSLSELDEVDEQGFADLVWSGNSIEHITESEADRMIQGAYRMLKPGGHFCLDTPNRLVTEKLFHGELSHPDHKLEYDHTTLSAKLERHGFEIVEAYGVMDCQGVDLDGPFTIPVQMGCPAFTHDLDQAFFLYYHCEKPEAEG